MKKIELIPQVGMGCTLSLVSCFPHTIVEVVNEKKIVIQMDSYNHITGEITQNKEAIKQTYTKRKNGLWAILGGKRVGFLTIGERKYTLYDN